MTKGEQRRQRLGEQAVAAARESARSATPPERALIDAVTALLAFRVLHGLDAPEQPREQSA